MRKKGKTVDQEIADAIMGTEHKTSRMSLGRGYHGQKRVHGQKQGKIRKKRGWREGEL